MNGQGRSHRIRKIFRLVFGVTGVAVGVVACSDDEVAVPLAVACPQKVGEVCVGVTRPVLCEPDGCTDGASCTSVAAATDDGSLAAALGAAPPGSCVTLAPGSYGPVSVPAGVSVLGRGADLVTVAGVELAAGPEVARVQGITAGAGGVRLIGPGTLELRQVRVVSATGAGVELGEGAAASLVNVEILGATQFGLRAVDAGDVEVIASWVDGAEGPGVISACTDGCACASPGTFAAESLLVREASHVGVFLSGTAATFAGVTIDGTRVQGLEANSGGGLSVSACASLDARALTVSRSDYFGVLVDDASATLSGKPDGSDAAEEKGIIIHDNVFGVWLSSIGATQAGQVELDAVVISESKGVGLGVGPEAEGIIIHDMEIRDTALKTLPVAVGGAEDVGDGLLWGNGAQIAIDGLSVSGSARQSVLVDEAFGEGSSLENITLSEGDEDKGILQQSFTGGGPDPDVGVGVPTIDTVPNAQFALPVPPASPSGVQ